MPTIRNIAAWIFIILLFSCNNENRTHATYTVLKKNFENILHIDGYVEPEQSTTIVCPRDIDGVVTFLIEDGTEVKEGDVVCVIEYTELKNNYDNLLIELENAKVELSKTKADLEMQYALLEAQVKNNEANTKITQLDSLQLIYMPPLQRQITELELEKAAIEKVKYEKKLQALSIIQQSEIRKMELKIQNLTNRVSSIKEQLDNLTLKAPRKGLAIRPIYRITNTKLQVNDAVWTNMPLMIIPEMKKMKVKILAPEKDYKYISVNDSVMFTFDAMPENKAWGKIRMKAPVGQQLKENSKVKFFEIEATIDSTLATPDPGFTANCHIYLKEIKDTLVIPQIAIFEEDSVKVVYVKNKSAYEMRQIQTGLSSPKEAIISKGLKANEIISLSKPENTLIELKTFLPDTTARQMRSIRELKIGKQLK